MGARSSRALASRSRKVAVPVRPSRGRPVPRARFLRSVVSVRSFGSGPVSAWPSSRRTMRPRSTGRQPRPSELRVGERGHQPGALRVHPAEAAQSLGQGLGRRRRGARGATGLGGAGVRPPGRRSRNRCSLTTGRSSASSGPPHRRWRTSCGAGSRRPGRRPGPARTPRRAGASGARAGRSGCAVATALRRTRPGRPPRAWSRRRWRRARPAAG